MERKLCLLQCDASNTPLFPLPPPTHPSPCFLAETSGGGKPFPPPASGRPPCVPGIHPWNCSPHLKGEKSRVWLDKTKIRWLEVTLCKPSATLQSCDVICYYYTWLKRRPKPKPDQLDETRYTQFSTVSNYFLLFSFALFFLFKFSFPFWFQPFFWPFGVRRDLWQRRVVANKPEGRLARRGSIWYRAQRCMFTFITNTLSSNTNNTITTQTRLLGQLTKCLCDPQNPNLVPWQSWGRVSSIIRGKLLSFQLCDSWCMGIAKMLV